MCSSRRALALLAAAVLLVPGAAHAYVDPGTAGLIVGGGATILGWAAVAFATLKFKLYRLFGGLFGAMRKRPGPSALLAVLLVLVGSIALSQWLSSKDGAASAVSARSDRVVLLGLDGVDPRMLKELVDGGLLPNFAALAERGALLPLAIPNPPQSPVVWASLATGQNPGKHGVYDFIGRDPDEYLPSLALLSRSAGGYEYPIRAKAFWDVTSEHGVPATIIRWPMTFPPKNVVGRVLPGLGVPDVRGGLGRYSYFTDRAPEEGEQGREKVTIVEVKDGVVQTALSGPQARGLSGVKDLTLPLTVKLAEDGRGALLTVGGRSVALAEGEWSDHVELTFTSGLFAKHLGQLKFLLVSGREPFALFATAVELHPDAPVVAFTHPPEYAAELKKAIGPFHTLGMPEDTKALGEGRITEEHFLKMCRDVEEERRRQLMYEVDRFDRGVLAFVFDTSDRIQHMTPMKGDLPTSPIGRYLVEFDRFLGDVVQKLPEGTPLILFSDHGFTRFDRAVDLNRWLVEQGYMVIDEAAYAARAPGTAGELYRYVDWSKTKAYAVGFAGIYVNVEGREGKGIVAAEQRAAVAAEIAEKLQGLSDPKDGAPVVHRVYPREELYPGPRQSDAPDLVVGFKEGFRGSWQTAVGGVSPEVVVENEEKWQRDHIVDASFVPGMLVTNFPVKVKEPAAYDLAPTVLGFLGLPVPDEMEGRLLQGGDAQVAERGERRVPPAGEHEAE